MPFSKGDQIIYVPSHVREDADRKGLKAGSKERTVFYTNHRDTQFGFVTSVKRNDLAFCRYWRTSSARRSFDDLRTKANSEATPTSLLTKYTLVPQSAVEGLIVEIESGSHN